MNLDFLFGTLLSFSISPEVPRFTDVFTPSGPVKSGLFRLASVFRKPIEENGSTLINRLSVTNCAGLSAGSLIRSAE